MYENVYLGINHQMDFYPSAYLVIPYLVKLLEQKLDTGDTEWVEYCLFNIGMTLVSDNILTRRQNRAISIDDEVKQNYKLCKRRKKIKEI